MRRTVPVVIAALVGIAAGHAVAGLDVPPAPLDVSGFAQKSDLPSPGTVAPPGVAVDGALGSGQQYALANHTHATSVQRARMSVSPAGQPVRWTFAKPYDAGVVPVVVCTAQSTAGATLPYVVNTVGDPTNTYADLIVFRAQTQTLGGTLVSIAGTTVNLFATAPSGTTVNCQAARATQ